MESNDARSNVEEEPNEKRQTKLTPKAFEHKVEKIQEERQTKVRKIKNAIREIKGLMQSAGNAGKIRICLENISSLFTEARRLHGVVLPMLPPEEKEKQNSWFVSIEEHKTAFVNEAHD